jgi:mono/diheme cytochrome c family protein
MIRRIPSLLAFGVVLISMLSFAEAQENQIKKTQVKPTNPMSGAQMFKHYCAGCHGPGAKGDGPVARALKVPTPDLTTLAKRHNGEFPDDYVSNVLRNGLKASAHGSGKMPVWGPIFEAMDRWTDICPCKDETPDPLRITKLTNYLKSIQTK